MSRESWMESRVPANGAEGIPYQDNPALLQGVLRHATEFFVGRVTGAGGVGGTITGVPFEPMVVRAFRNEGTRAIYESIFTAAAPVHMEMILAMAVNATPPTVTKVADNNYTIGLPVGMAPDGQDVTVIAIGANSIAGSL